MSSMVAMVSSSEIIPAVILPVEHGGHGDLLCLGAGDEAGGQLQQGDVPTVPPYTHQEPLDR